MKKLPPPPRRSSLGTLAFKKKPQPTTSNSGTLVEQEPPKPTKEPLFSDLNKTVDSPSSYHDMQADIPISPADQMPKQQALPIAYVLYIILLSKCSPHNDHSVVVYHLHRIRLRPLIQPISLTLPR